MIVNFADLWEETIQSQYGASPHIKGLIKKFAARIDPSQDIQSFFNNVFNPLTAVGVGLDIWGEIVGVGRYVETEGEDVFGFWGSNLYPFNQAPFYQDGATKIYRLEDEAYRKLIFCKAYANISGSAMPEVKTLLRFLFGDGTIAIQAETIGIMKIRFIFPYSSTLFEVTLLKNYGILNVGAGVGVEFYNITINETFGFYGSDLQGFDNGIFAPYSIQELEN